MSGGQNTKRSTALKEPWKPGQSGNPGGRPALPAEFKAKGPEALAKLAAFMDHKNPQIALRATELVTNRIFGAAAQPLEHGGSGEMLDLLAERLAKRMNGHEQQGS